jgi:membrane associated rhomboid family serine protease
MDTPGTDLDAARSSHGPLTAATARALIDHGRERLDAGEPGEALADFRRVIGHQDPELTAAAWLGAGDALYRLDAEPDATGAWEAVTRLPETPSTYRAWRQLAGARVRAGDLAGATAAYREADRRAPQEDKAEIAGRLGWLAKESGNAGAAQRYFSRSRGGGRGVPLTYAIIGVTVAISLATSFSGGEALLTALWLDKAKVVAGELYRLWTVTLVHDPGNLLHLGFNMYALYILGPIVETIWGSRLFLLFYLLAAAAASTASLVMGPAPAVGAAGAIFGLVGVLVAGTRVHLPVLDQRARAVLPQLGFIILL